MAATVEVGRADATAAQPKTPSERARVELRLDLVAGAVVAVATVAVLVLVLQLWRADLRVPFVYDTPPGDPLVFSGDGPFYLMLVEGLIRHGSYLFNPSLAAPFGQELHDLVHGADNLQFGVLWAMGKTLRDAALVVNLYFLATFVAVSLVTFFVYRRLGLSRWTAAVIGVLYSFLPYHFARGTAHLLLTAYFAVPIAALLMLRVLSDEPPFTRRAGEGWKVALRSKRSLWWVLGCAVIGSTGAYYAIIPVILLVLAVAVDFAARRRWRTVASGAVASVVVAVVLLVNISPTLLYWARHGSNDVVATRGPSETEINGLKVSQLLLPVEGHRIDAFADLQAKSTRFSVLFGERGQGLGIIGALGFLGLLGVLLADALNRRRGPPTEARAVLHRSGVITVIALLCGVVSGLSLLFAGAGLTQIRSWNRVSIYIAFFSFLAVGVTLDWLLRRLPQVRWRGALTGAVLGAVLVFGLFDQVSAKAVPDYDRLARDWDEDAEYFDAIAADLGPGAMVFQYPWIRFPEAGITVNAGPYDQAKGFIHAPELDWSWGGVEGRDEDWTAEISNVPARDMVDGVAAAGFSGLLVDRDALPYGPLAVETELTRILDQEPFVSPDERYAFYDLRAYAAELEDELTAEELAALREQTLSGDTLP